MPQMETPPEPARIAAVSSRAWYGASISEFLETQTDTIVGRLTRNSDFSLLPTQKETWLAQISAGQGGRIFTFAFHISSESPKGRTAMSGCYHRFSANGDFFRPYRNIFAAKITP